MNHKPTAEQERIFLFTKKRQENILIRAYAGTGKTTTIVEAVKLLPKDKNIMFLAFNKHIQEELKTKLPEYVRCYTTYGIGTGAIKRKYGDSIEFDDEEAINFYLNSIKKLCNLCRLTLTNKPEFVPYIADRYDVNLKKPKDIKRVLKVLDEMSVDRNTYDFTDMIYLPAIDNGIWFFPQDYVFVDEVQDLNRCQIKIVEKVLKKDRISKKIKGRLISVGDFFQGVYGFNAADEKSFEWFEKFQNTKILPLSVSFRCSQNVIKEAQKIVPDIKALPDAPDGIVRDGSVL